MIIKGLFITNLIIICFLLGVILIWLISNELCHFVTRKFSRWKLKALCSSWQWGLWAFSKNRQKIVFSWRKNISKKNVWDFFQKKSKKSNIFFSKSFVFMKKKCFLMIFFENVLCIFLNRFSHKDIHNSKQSS